ncbi:hypothetical protein D3C85_1912870 [compost metagenome]
MALKAVVVVRKTPVEFPFAEAGPATVRKAPDAAGHDERREDVVHDIALAP